MKTRLATCFCLLGLVFSCKKSNFQKSSVTIGNMSIFNPKPEPGQELTIYYTSENREFLDDQFAAYYYILVGNTIYQEDLEMEDSDENKKAEIHIPDSATAIAFNFKNGDNYDINNNSGYVFELYNEDKPVPGALAAKSNFHLQMDSYIGIEAPHTDSILHWLKTDIEQYPDIEEDWLKTYAKTLLKNDRAKGEKYLKEGLVDLEEKEKSSEKDYTILTFIYDQLQEADKKDSIRKLAIKQYPKGKAAQEEYNTKFIKAASHEEQTEIFKAYQKNIGKDGRIKDAMLSRLAAIAEFKGDFNQLVNLAEQMQDRFRAAQFYHSLAMIKLESEEVDDAVVFSERAIKALKEGNPEGKPKLLNQNQLHDDIEEDIREARYIYASALFKKGALPEAINELEKIIGAGEIPVLNERYVQFLIENENYKKAEQKAKKFIVSGKATEALRSNFKKAYQQNHAIDDVEDKLAALEEEGYEKLKEEFASRMMDKEVPELHLNDTHGNSIHLKDLK